MLVICGKFFNMTKHVPDVRQMLWNTYGKAAIREWTCWYWLPSFRNSDFHTEGRHDGRRTIWTAIGSDVTISKHPKNIGIIQKQENSVPYQKMSNGVYLVVNIFIKQAKRYCDETINKFITITSKLKNYRDISTIPIFPIFTAPKSWSGLRKNS